MMAAQWVVETRDLTRIYDSGVEVRALDGIHLQVAPGEFVAIMGPSGSGKSTLLNVLGALDRPTSGQVWVNGQDLSTIHDLDRFRSQTVGFVFQMHNLLPTMTAIENVEVPMMGILSAGARRKRAKELLALVGLEQRSHHLPGQLSGGQRQRVAIARALANHPPLILADEPTGNLDTQASTEVMDLLRQLNQSQGVSFLVVTHDPSIARQTQRVVTMRDGKIVSDSRMGSPLQESLNEWRTSLLGEALMANDQAALDAMGMSHAQAAALREVLETEK